MLFSIITCFKISCWASTTVATQWASFFFANYCISRVEKKTPSTPILGERLWIRSRCVCWPLFDKYNRDWKTNTSIDLVEWCKFTRALLQNRNINSTRRTIPQIFKRKTTPIREQLVSTLHLKWFLSSIGYSTNNNTVGWLGKPATRYIHHSLFFLQPSPYAKYSMFVITNNDVIPLQFLKWYLQPTTIRRKTFVEQIIELYPFLWIVNKSLFETYHPGGVLKGRCSVNKILFTEHLPFKTPPGWYELFYWSVTSIHHFFSSLWTCQAMISLCCSVLWLKWRSSCLCTLSIARKKSHWWTNTRIEL